MILRNVHYRETLLRKRIFFMKKGYVFVIFFALCIAILSTLKYRIILEKNSSQITGSIITIQIVVLFMSFLIPGLFLVRWYYKHKRH
jgi:hypothetical protein